MPSDTIRRAIARHAENADLYAPTLLPAPTSARDLSRDQATRPLPPTVVEQATSALDEGQTHYVPVPGIPPLREKVAAFLRAANGLSTVADNILITAGLQEARFLTSQKIGEQLGGIALPTVVHPGARQAVGVRPLDVALMPVAEDTLLPTLAGIRTALEDGRRLLYLESPARLTGAVYDAGDVAAIADLITAHDATVIWDQGLAPWAAPEAYTALAAATDDPARVVTIGELWPGRGLASWQIAFIAADEAWLGAAGIQSHKQIISICTSTATQYAALAAADDYDTWHERERARLQTARDAAVEQARAAGAEPLPGTAVNQLALRLTDAPAARDALAGAGFTVADGAHFGQPDVLRFAVTGDDTLRQALNHLATR